MVKGSISLLPFCALDVPSQKRSDCLDMSEDHFIRSA